MKRISTTETAELLGVSPSMAREYAKAGWLSSHTTSGKHTQGQRLYFDATEVEAFARGGAPAAKAYRESLADQSAAPARRGRRKPVTA